MPCMAMGCNFAAVVGRPIESLPITMPITRGARWLAGAGNDLDVMPPAAWGRCGGGGGGVDLTMLVPRRRGSAEGRSEG